jgi:RNA polymerase sigma-70 factor (ECF subfamily)
MMVQADATPTESDRERRFKALVERHLDFVARVLLSAGTPHAEVDDEVQRTLITAARRLDDMRPGCEKRFLMRVALHTAAHSRRTAARRREVAVGEIPDVVDVSSCPEYLTEQRRARQRLADVLGEMEITERKVFVLFELNNLSMAEIAEMLAIPCGTVASRLRRARADFFSRFSEAPFEASAQLGRERARRVGIGEPVDHEPRS